MKVYSGEPLHLEQGKPTVRFALTSEAKAAGLPLPARSYEHDAGFDLRVLTYDILNLHEAVHRNAETQCVVSTGVRASIPPGWCGIIRERSSWAKAGLQIFGGVIDSGYSGEIKVICLNFETARGSIASDEQFKRFAQLVITRIWDGAVEYADELDATERGADGFGSTGQS